MSFKLSILLTFALNCIIVAFQPVPIPQERFKYKFGDYWSQDDDSCIVADATLPGTNGTFSGVASIHYCDGNYTINNRTLILPRNTMPICGYIPIWYDLTATGYLSLSDKRYKDGNSTFNNYKKECFEVLSEYSKSRFETMYDVNVHNLMCTRYADLLTVAYGLDPKIVELVNEIEKQIIPSLKWKNSKQQAYNFLSSICIATNKGSCIDLVRHILDERDNSILNLLGQNICQKPTTWLYADGIDIKMVQIFIEIMGMTLETQEVKGINYFKISTQASSGPFIWRNPGLVGGFIE